MKKQGTEMPPEKAADAFSWLEPGRVYRTGDLAAWSTNAPRLARHLVEQGALVPLAHGLFVHPRRGRFGLVPPVDEEVMRAFLGGAPFVFTGAARRGRARCSKIRRQNLFLTNLLEYTT